MGDLQVNHLDLQNVTWVCILDKDRPKGWFASVVGVKVGMMWALASKGTWPLLLPIGSKVTVSKRDIVSRGL